MRENINLQEISPFAIFFSLILFKNGFLSIEENMYLFKYEDNLLETIEKLSKLIFKFPEKQSKLNLNFSDCTTISKLMKKILKYLSLENVLLEEDYFNTLNSNNFFKNIKINNEFFYKSIYKCYIYKFLGKDTSMFKTTIFSSFTSDLKERNVSCQELANFALECLNLKTKYKWGKIMEFSDTENCYLTDCSGLIKAYFFRINNLKYNILFDLNSNMMWEIAKIKGNIKTLPEKKGLCLYMKGHVGIYIGNNEVIESTNNKIFGNGVVKTNIKDREWLGWFQYFLLEN